MIPPEIFVVPIVFGTPAAVVVAFRWMRHREHMAGLPRGAGPARASELEAGSARVARLEAQLGHVAAGVEAVAVEVERISEGQRFVTRLLAERGAGYAPTPAEDPTLVRGRVVTPH